LEARPSLKYEIQQDGRWKEVYCWMYKKQSTDPKDVANLGREFTAGLLSNRIWDMQFALPGSSAGGRTITVFE
jgi:adenine C2-methylase RlmN of 23S rRNA A2503 and tRNA A37